ncbi:heat-inducible transcriptional repressor HrcA [Inmirania thermothiophila]|uniref:heat-inducible transcriptional repressor HrcA n=1 Tax=Inmirania thermothiophila TaxID=1750597 RepID=UPI00319E0A7B
MLSERAQRLLKVLVERYIRDGHPVGSRTLARDAGLEISPATVRNVMADLEELGLVTSPHTSAGRVPTVKGYRFFVDALLTMRPPGEEEVERLRAGLDQEAEPEELVAAASSLLSEITRMAGVVTLPRRERFVLREVEFLPLSGNRVLVVMVSTEGEVQNRIIHTQRVYDRRELERAARYLTHNYAGRELAEVRERLVAEMREVRAAVDRAMGAIVEVADKALVPERREDYVLRGETQLMGFAELGSLERLRRLFEAFNEKSDLLHLLDQCLHARGVQIFIGEESGFEVLDQCSVVTAPYSVDGRRVGVLGVIGPTRMAYQRVIPLVDVTARLLSAALNQRH